MNRYYDNKLDMSCFVQSLLAYGMEHNRITATQLQKVQNELFDVTQNEWMKYVDDRQELELSVEKMDQIFQSVCYRIGVGIQYEIYEKEQKIELSKNNFKPAFFSRQNTPFKSVTNIYNII